MFAFITANHSARFRKCNLLFVQQIHKVFVPLIHKSAKSLFHKSEINYSNPCLPLLQPTTVLDFGKARFYLLDKLKTSFKWGLWKRALLYQISDIWSQYKMMDCHMKKCDQAFQLHSQYFVKNGCQYLLYQSCLHWQM